MQCLHRSDGKDGMEKTLQHREVLT